ncbi:MAG: RNA-binding domain-containing protein [Candidatus Woesearchaeota archaeon]|nr:RNA-binding domain-containing protein [Candidatus Woesearchaeota archaeon]
MKLANSVKISVFAKEEDSEKILNKLISLVPFNLEEEKIALNKQNASGFNDKTIKIFEITLTKDRHINGFLEFLNSKLTQDQKELLIQQAEPRTDDDLNFFIRLDKEKLFNDEFCITDSGNCYHIRISLAVFPKKKENSLAVVKEIFK